MAKKGNISTIEPEKSESEPRAEEIGQDEAFKREKRREKLLGVWVRSKTGATFRVRDGQTKADPVFIVTGRPVFLRTKSARAYANDRDLEPVEYEPPLTEEEYQLQRIAHAERIAQERAHHDAILSARRAEANQRGGSPLDAFVATDDDEAPPGTATFSPFQAEAR